jgi:hypothetical protein
MYRLTICADRSRGWFVIDRSNAPAVAALVAWLATEFQNKLAIAE